MVKNSPDNTGDTAGGEDSIPGSARPFGEGNGNSLQYSCLENPTNRGSLVSYSPWGSKESDTTQRLKQGVVSFFTAMTYSSLHIRDNTLRYSYI